MRVLFLFSNHQNEFVTIIDVDSFSVSVFPCVLFPMFAQDSVCPKSFPEIKHEFVALNLVFVMSLSCAQFALFLTGSLRCFFRLSLFFSSVFIRFSSLSLFLPFCIVLLFCGFLSLSLSPTLSVIAPCPPI